MTEQHKTIIERVQKLMQLEQGAKEIGSLEEAANAAEKVQRLLMKYNLEMSDISRHTPEEAQSIGRMKYQDVKARKNEGQWIYRLYSVLATHNFCDIVFTTFYDPEQKKKNKYVNLIGTKENVEVVKFLAEQLEARLRILEGRAWNSGSHYGEKRGAFRRGYFMGAAQGIGHQLDIAKQQMIRDSPQTSALVVQTDKQLAEAVAALFPNLRMGKAPKRLSGQQGAAHGFRDGSSMSINSGIQGGGSHGALNG